MSMMTISAMSCRISALDLPEYPYLIPVFFIAVYCIIYETCFSESNYVVAV